MENKITVSELFLDIYRLFNVSDQRERIKQLTKKEIYFLLHCAMDNHNEDDIIVIVNFSDYEFEVNEILEFQETEKTTNQYLLDLVKETDDACISTSVIELPTPYTREEVRDLKLGGILD